MSDGNKYLADNIHVGNVHVLADSINSDTDSRLTTFLLDGFPKCLLAELNTHRHFCITGDALLRFGMAPGRYTKASTFTMTVEKFATKWFGDGDRYTLRTMQIQQFNEETKAIQTSHVKNVYDTGTQTVIKLYAEDEVSGRRHTLVCTPQHKVLTGGGWKMAGDLIVGEDYLLADGVSPAASLVPTEVHKAHVTKIEPAGETQTYDLEIEGDYPNFFANGLVVHNSRNAASSRAIPLNKMITNLRERPYIPFWTRKRSGMAGSYTISKEEADSLTEVWLSGMETAITKAQELHEMGAAKQEVNRLLEPWTLVPVVLSSTEWVNFLRLRIDESAQPDFRFTAIAIMEALNKNTITVKKPGKLHIPFLDSLTYPVPSTLTDEQRLKVATARAARVSYTTHDGNFEPEKDYALHDSLLAMKHMSPFEHSAVAITQHTVEADGKHNNVQRNFTGWVQYRVFAESGLHESGVSFAEWLTNGKHPKRTLEQSHPTC